MHTLAYKVMDLIPLIRKHTFAPEIDPSNLIDDKAEFYALCGFDWSKPNFQTAEEDEEPQGVIQSQAKKNDLPGGLYLCSLKNT